MFGLVNESLASMLRILCSKLQDGESADGGSAGTGGVGGGGGSRGQIKFSTKMVLNRTAIIQLHYN